MYIGMTRFDDTNSLELNHSAIVD